MSGGDQRVLNLGLVSANGVAIQGSEGNDTIENRGSIVSTSGRAIDLGAGNDVLTLFTSGRVAGTMAGGSGVDLVVLDGDGVVGANLNLFNTFEQLLKNGLGTWVLTGSSDMAWRLANGRLFVDGALTGAGRVDAGTTLGGNGLVGGFTNDGTVAPGASIGTLRVLGDYEQRAGGVLQIEGSIASGVSDQLTVSGKATLGGTLDVVPETRPFGVATEYQIVQANGGVSGTFDTVHSGLDVLTPSLEYSQQGVTLVLIRSDVSFGAMGNTANGQALGAALDHDKRAMARGDFKGLMDTFLGVDEAGQRDGLASLTGELHATAARAMQHAGERLFNASVDRRLSADRASNERAAAWVDTIHFGGDLDADGNASAATYGAGGLAGGADLIASERTRLGASMGYAPGDAKLASGTGTATTRSYYPAVYGDYDTGRWSAGAAFGYGNHQIDTVRTVRVGAIDRIASAQYHADQYLGLLRGGWSVRGLSSSVGLKAFGELRFSTLKRPGFGEAGADSANLAAVERATANSLRSVIGMRATWASKVFGARVTPELKGAWAHESQDRQSEMTAALSGATWLENFERFTIRSVSEARDSLLVTAGASAAFADHGSAYLTYDGLMNGTGSEHGFSAGLRLYW
jgi:outer membrane autotransporter protein